ALVGDVLIVPDQLAGLGPDGDHARGIETVGAAAIGRIVRLGVAGAPIDQVELGVVGPVLPGRATAVLPGIGHLPGPGLCAGLARRGNGVAAPQMLAGRRVPAVEEAAGGAVAAGHAGDQHAVGDERRDDAGVAFLVVGELLLPELLAGLHVERDDV